MGALGTPRRSAVESGIANIVDGLTGLFAARFLGTGWQQTQQARSVGSFGQDVV